MTRRYPSASNRCPNCGSSFRTLEDEVGMHECPHCGYDGHKRPADDDDRDEDANKPEREVHG